MRRSQKPDTVRKTKSLHYIFYAMVILVFLYFLLGEIFLPKENDVYGDNYRELKLSWYTVDQNAIRTPVEVPGKCSVARGETLTIEATLPSGIDDKEYLCFRSSQQDMKIYIGGKVRTEYSTKETRLFGKSSASAYVFVPVSSSDEGEEIRVEATSNSKYSGVLNKVYIGGKMSIWKAHIAENGAEFAIAVFMVMLGLIVVVVSVMLRIFCDKNIMLEYLGWGIVLVSVWIIAESKLRQLFFSNITIISTMAFIAIMMVPIPFSIYFNSVQHGRYHKMYNKIIVVSILNFVVSVTLQITNVFDFLETMTVAHIIVVIAGATIIITMIKDFKAGLIKEYRHMVWGFFVFLLLGLVELIRIYLSYYVITGIFVSAGMIFMLIMACIKTGQEVISREREKQRMMLSQATQIGFLAHMSHEIRTPLNTIIGMNEMILREETSDVVRRYAINVKTAGKTMEAMIGDVLDFAKIQGGSFDIEQSTYYLASLINDSIHLLKASAENKQIEVKYNIDETMPSILKGDEIRIKRILNVLMENAVKHTEGGSITLSIQGDVNDSGQFILIMSVADTGRGIRKEEIDTLFDSVSVKRKEHDNNQNVNLRLDIIKRFVSEMGGEIKVSSLYGTGSLFSVKIPQQIISKEPIGDIHKEYKRECSNENIVKERLYAPEAVVLVVDDVEMNLEVVKGMLKNSGIHLDFAVSGEEAILRCREKKYDLIFMDHMMPELDGIETLHLIKKDAEGLNRETSVVALTANVVTGIREKYLQEGFREYISKPIDSVKLERVLYTQLEGKASYLFEEKKEKKLPDAEQRMLKHIDRHVGLTYCAGDEEMYLDILKTYYEQGNDYRITLAAAYEKRDWKLYAIKAHALKSVSLTIGAKAFSETAKKHEFAGKEENETLILNEYQQFMDDYAEVLEEVKEIYGITEPGEDFESSPEDVVTEEVSKEQYEESVKELLAFIEAYEMNEALELIRALQQKAIIEERGEEKQERNEMLHEAGRAIDEFDYEKAEEIVSAWLKG